MKLRFKLTNGCMSFKPLVVAISLISLFSLSTNTLAHHAPDLDEDEDTGQLSGWIVLPRDNAQFSSYAYAPVISEAEYDTLLNLCDLNSLCSLLSIFAPAYPTNNFTGVIVGHDGGGYMNHTVGDLYTGELYIGFHESDGGTYVLHDNNLARLTTGHLLVGYQGTGNVLQNGGHITASEVSIASGSDARGDYVLAGGTLTANNVHVGRNGEGLFVHNDGTARVHHIKVGSDGVGEYRMTGPVSSRIDGYHLTLGEGVDSEGTFDLSGNAIVDLVSELNVGRFGTGTFNHHSSIVSAGSINIGVFEEGSGVYNFNDGEINLRGCATHRWFRRR